MFLATGDLIALVPSFPSDGRKVRTLLVLRINDDGSHDVVDLAWSGLGGGGLVLRLQPVALAPSTRVPNATATVVCARAAEAKLSSEPMVDYGQRKLEFKGLNHLENARPTGIAFVESLCDRKIPVGAKSDKDILAAGTVCQFQKGDRLAWFAVTERGTARHFFCNAEPMTVLAVSYSEEGGSRDSSFTIVSESADLSATFENLVKEFRKTPFLRRQ